MPFTPFHMGAGLALKAAADRRFSVLMFGWAQVAMDLEPAAGLLLGWERLHGWTHTYLGAALIGTLVLLVGRPPSLALLRWWNRGLRDHGMQRFAAPESLPVGAAAAGALVGTFSHVALDSVMHADMRPFAPWLDGNALLAALCVPALHGSLVAMGLAGATLWALRQRSAGVTRDGCHVELYRRLPYAGEIEHFAARLAAGAHVLEMGCATGRMTRPLLERGFRVTAVDNSAEMLALAPDAARKVLADIEGLRLGRTFDAVLLASCFMNVADARARARILAACAAHLAPGAPLVFERHDVAWLRSVQPGPVGKSGDVAIVVQSVERNGGRVAMSLRYEHGGERWIHEFETCEMDDAAIARALDAAGFEPPQWLDERRRWGWAPRR